MGVQTLNNEIKKKKIKHSPTALSQWINTVCADAEKRADISLRDWLLQEIEQKDVEKALRTLPEDVVPAESRESINALMSEVDRLSSLRKKAVGELVQAWRSKVVEPTDKFFE